MGDLIALQHALPHTCLMYTACLNKNIHHLLAACRHASWLYLLEFYSITSKAIRARCTMASSIPRKSIFTAEERALIRPFQATYLAAKSSAARKDIAITTILPSLIGKWEAELPPGEVIDTDQASKVHTTSTTDISC